VAPRNVALFKPPAFQKSITPHLCCLIPAARCLDGLERSEATLQELAFGTQRAEGRSRFSYNSFTFSILRRQFLERDEGRARRKNLGCCFQRALLNQCFDGAASLMKNSDGSMGHLLRSDRAKVGFASPLTTALVGTGRSS
jgi:hypothetical protein